MRNTIKFLSVIIVITILTMIAMPTFGATGVVLSENRHPIYPDVMGEGNKKYEQDFLKVCDLNWEGNEWLGQYFYEPLYEYYKDENTTSIPDYVLVFAGGAISLPAYVFGNYGNYVISAGGHQVPFTLGYCIYIPKSEKVLSLRKAYDSGIEGIEEIFTDYGLGKLRGDMDKDRKLTIKDATYIQKCVAGVTNFSEDDKIRGGDENNSNIFLTYLSDFNRDGVRNIKDATAIQKHIAGIEA